MNAAKHKVPLFRRQVWDYYRLHRRNFPWRRTKNPYRILVSEIMLQQTQVERVIPKYHLFLKRFPSFAALAKTSNREVLAVWQGLGYNRRALLLKKLADIVMRDYRGKLPKDFALLAKLPGVGRATAGAIMAYAFGAPVPFLETNIRRAYIHFFFPKRHSVSDCEILKFVEVTLDRKNPRAWFWALTDYGAMLGRTIENPNRRSASYKKQSRFEGSDRQLRGKIIKLFIEKHSRSLSETAMRVAEPKARVHRILKSLEKEGFLARRSIKFTLV